jgi:hypothetical protein
VRLLFAERALSADLNDSFCPPMTNASAIRFAFDWTETVNKIRLRRVLKDLATTPILAFRGYGTGKIFEDDLVEQVIEPATNIEYWRNHKIAVPGSLIGADYPHAFENIEVDVFVRRPVKGRGAARTRVNRAAYEIKYQSCPGTAEDKIVASARRLALLLRARKIDEGFIVVGGDAWNALPLYMAASEHPKIKVISEADFARKAARRQL